MIFSKRIAVMPNQLKQGIFPFNSISLLLGQFLAKCQLIKCKEHSPTHNQNTIYIYIYIYIYNKSL